MKTKIRRTGSLKVFEALHAHDVNGEVCGGHLVRAAHMGPRPVLGQE